MLKKEGSKRVLAEQRGSGVGAMPYRGLLLVLFSYLFPKFD